ncbi:MAG: regulatory signaling modulator protein AmpE [Gammaproteobacteria bacterium]|nr:regulatory signaling modulator protein AmpE [Gammaproteobacteria bacterium]
MNFIVIVVALLLDQVIRWFEHARLHRWYERPLADWAAQVHDAPAAVQFLAAVLPSFILAFAIGAIAWGLSSASTLLGFIWAVIVLVLSLGPRNLGLEISAYLKARAAGDEKGARRSAGLLLQADPPAVPMDCARAVSEASLLRAGDWLFSVLFWFALLGPLGAVLFRMADTFSVRAAADQPGSAYARSAEALKRVLAWVPMHLLVLTYALAGGMDETLAEMRRTWRNATTHFLEWGDAAVISTGRAVVRGIVAGGSDEVELLHTTVNVIWRGLIIWLAVIGVITLLGWLF